MILSVAKVIDVDLGDAIDNDIEGWNDILSERATGGPYLTNIFWGLVGFRPGNVLQLKVEGQIDTEDADFDAKDIVALKADIGEGNYTVENDGS